jgi:hypothetical protein
VEQSTAGQENATDQAIKETRDEAPVYQNYQQQFSAPATLGYKELEPGRVAIGRGESGTPIAPAAGSLDTANQTIIFRPSYLPPNFYLTRIESDLNDSLSLYYENPQGGFICLKTLPGLDQETEVMKDGGGSNASQSMENLNKTQETPDNSTVIRWTSQYQNTTFRLELTGSLPPEELARVAASVK